MNPQTNFPGLLEAFFTDRLMHQRQASPMDLLQHGVDRTAIALWLGHETVDTVQVYLHANLAMKEQALAKTMPFGVKPGCYRPDDQLLAFLKSL
jgi:hypothetical protein